MMPPEIKIDSNRPTGFLVFYMAVIHLSGSYALITFANLESKQQLGFVLLLISTSTIFLLGIVLFTLAQLVVYYYRDVLVAEERDAFESAINLDPTAPRRA